MNRWKENLGTKKRTGDGAARWARRIFCAFLIVIGCLVLADGVGEKAGIARRDAGLFFKRKKRLSSYE